MKSFKSFISEYDIMDFGFSDDETKPKSSGKSSSDKTTLGAKRGSIVKIKNTKWEVFRVEDDYNFSVYKHPSAKRKLYRLRNVKGDEFEVFLMGGSGQRLSSKPEVTGKASIFKL